VVEAELSSVQEALKMEQHEHSDFRATTVLL
jgi:hypothetical protein